MSVFLQIYTVLFSICYAAGEIRYEGKSLEGQTKAVFRTVVFLPILTKILGLW